MTLRRQQHAQNREQEDFVEHMEQAYPDTYPTTWPGVVADWLRRNGLQSSMVIILLAMLCVVFYYLQKGNEREQVTNGKLIICISEATATMRGTMMTTQNQEAAMRKHESWEEEMIKENIPRLTRLEDDMHRLTQQPRKSTE